MYRDVEAGGRRRGAVSGRLRGASVSSVRKPLGPPSRAPGDRRALAPGWHSDRTPVVGLEDHHHRLNEVRPLQPEIEFLNRLKPQARRCCTRCPATKTSSPLRRMRTPLSSGEMSNGRLASSVGHVVLVHGVGRRGLVGQDRASSMMNRRLGRRDWSGLSSLRPPT